MLSAHAGQSGLLEWFTAASGGAAAPRVMLTHGEEPQRHALAAVLQNRTSSGVHLPTRLEVVEL